MQLRLQWPFLQIPAETYEKTEKTESWSWKGGPCLIRDSQADRGGLAPVLLSWRYSRRLRFIKRALHHRGDNSIALLDLSECHAPQKYFQTAQKAFSATTYLAQHAHERLSESDNVRAPIIDDITAVLTSHCFLQHTPGKYMP